MKLIRLMSGIMLIFLPVWIFGYSYGAWVGITGNNTIALNPFYSINLSGNYDGTPDFKIDYGFSDKADIFMDISSGFVMPRYDFSGKNLLIGGVKLAAGGPGLQIHGIYDENSKFAIEYNVYYDFADWRFSPGVLGGILAPTFKLNKLFGLWVELDTEETSGLSYNIDAGIYINIGKSQLSIGLVNVYNNNGFMSSPSIGAWLWTPIKI